MRVGDDGLGGGARIAHVHADGGAPSPLAGGHERPASRDARDVHERGQRTRVQSPVLVRVQGGAYGAFAVFDDASGVFTYLSYRDPNVTTTIDAYDKAADFLKGLDSSRLTENELTKAIIAAIGDLDTYQLPDSKGYTSMMRYLTHRTDAMRQKTRDEVLSTNGEDFIAFGEVLEKVAQSNAVAVMGAQSSLESANLGLEVTKVL